MPIEQVEFNTIITFLGMLCATVQVSTGFYAAYYRKRAALLKTNDILFRAHRAFGSFATTLYFLGLFAGLNGLIGAVLRNDPPLELSSPSFNIHTWGSFPVFVVVIWKTFDSYFNKKPLYRNRKWLGIAMFLAWSYTWLTAATSYYLRTLPSNLQHPAPRFLLPFAWAPVQLALPFVLGGIIGGLILWRVRRQEQADQAKRAAREPALGGQA
ncbi:MAG: hypothetical protein KKA73_12560 [Chloroflexi bacterium]|nr:hypothetical protein [Chloroflexota bacterium]MBU1748512.1 hypothetical protein [Chloroflexota bacterium]MBU1878601.1 hypothetical protein [Chloroflexota bacterium]